MLRALAGGCLVAIALAFAACGGDDDSEPLSADAYRSKLDAACAEVTAANAQIPQTMSDEQLSVEEGEAIAEENGEKFKDEVRDLTPPDELADLHDDLIDGLDTEPPTDDIDAYIAFQEEGADLYDRIGASGCASGIRESNEALEEAHGDIGTTDATDADS